LQKALHAGQINVSVAEELWGISEEGDMEYYLDHAIESGCTKDTAQRWKMDWQAAQRRKRHGAEGETQLRSPYEPKPYYIACDICNKPALIEDAASVMICPVCRKVIRERQGE
ncbi:unnamed protein product, partial [marine sediment metagenome]